MHVFVMYNEQFIGVGLIGHGTLVAITVTTILVPYL